MLSQPNKIYLRGMAMFLRRNSFFFSPFTIWITKVFKHFKIISYVQLKDSAASYVFVKYPCTLTLSFSIKKWRKNKCILTHTTVFPKSNGGLSKVTMLHKMPSKRNMGTIDSGD
ncbi:hypothetical protein L6164_028000 [Bauhinia variegata]|uniref:Uncharacterized protein n=1 Tax=Bauhinia variegata TaxID=167791 RepID=A0ACB9LUZ1_BAUVA|nr:hypothetical protein L6164_028000 [Bauhinia variegata]